MEKDPPQKLNNQSPQSGERPTDAPKPSGRTLQRFVELISVALVSVALGGYVVSSRHEQQVNVAKQKTCKDRIDALDKRIREVIADRGGNRMMRVGQLREIEKTLKELETEFSAQIRNDPTLQKLVNDTRVKSEASRDALIEAACNPR